MSDLTPTLVVTHPGGAHTDDFLSCCLLAASYEVPIERRLPTEEDLTNNQHWVVDVGGKHEPALGNFDHHQFPIEQEPVQCALSLILKVLGLYETASKHCPWLEVTERMDVHGPNKTSAWMGINRDQLAQLHTPAHFSLVKMFGKLERLETSDPLYKIMQVIGGDLLSYLRTLEQKIAWFEKHALIHPVTKGKETFYVLQVERSEEVATDQSLGMFQFIEQHNAEKPDQLIIGTIMPDRRCDGYSLSRFQDHPCLDFNRVRDEQDVHFVHASGFVAKTERQDTPYLLELFSGAFKLENEPQP